MNSRIDATMSVERSLVSPLCSSRWSRSRGTSALSARIPSTLVTHQLAQRGGGAGRTLHRIDDPLERLVIDDDARRNEGFIRQLAPGLHEVEERLLDDVVLLQPMLLGEPVEPLLRRGRDAGRNLRVAHENIAQGNTWEAMEEHV
jgi:hypothetical protein